MYRPHSRSANTGAPSWLPRTPPEIRKLDQSELLDFCGGRTTLDRPFPGFFSDLPLAGLPAKLFVVAMFVTFAHAWRAKHRKAKQASTPSVLVCGWSAGARKTESVIIIGV